MVLNNLDGILIGILLIGAFMGYRKGFIKSAGAVIAIIVGLLAALIFWQPATDYLEKNYMIVSSIDYGIQGMVPIPTFDGLEGMVPSLYDSAQYAYRGATYHVARILVSALVFVLLLLLVAGFLKLVWSILSMSLNWGIIGAINRLGGMGFELAKVLLILAIVVGIANPFIKALARTGLPSAVNAQTYLLSSQLVPYLENIFQLMGRITGV